MNNGLAPATAWILTAAFAIAPPLLALAPLGMAPLVIATAVLAETAERVRKGRWASFPPRAATFFSVFLAWCALSLLWDLNAGSGLRKLGDVVLVTVSLLTLLGLADGLSPEQGRRLCKALIGGMLIGMLLLAIETLFDFPLYRAVVGDNAKLAD